MHVCTRVPWLNVRVRILQKEIETLKTKVVRFETEQDVLKRSERVLQEKVSHTLPSLCMYVCMHCTYAHVCVRMYNMSGLFLLCG